MSLRFPTPATIALGASFVALLVAATTGQLSCHGTSPPPPVADQAPGPKRPNILFCIADDWSRPHAGAYGDPVVRTPTFDRLAREGALFQNAYVTAPSCTPSRASILTGQWFWRLESAANLFGTFPDRFATYPELLAPAGYATGASGRLYGPGPIETPGRPLEGQHHASFREFLAQWPEDRPFCFWLGGFEPHRPYPRGRGIASGIDPDRIVLPPYYPDARAVRSDLADYYLAVQAFDALVADAVRALEELGRLEDTLVLMTSDNGLPFPRGKSNLYDPGVRVPLAVRWGERVKPGRVVEDFVSLADLAPTFLELAGVPVPGDMTGRSLVNVLVNESSGQVDPARDHVLTGKERHVPAQEAPDLGGYPMRAIRTRDFLYIRNFRPDRWPNGTPDYEHAAVPGFWFADIDDSPSKRCIIERREWSEARLQAFELCFAKRPSEELYALSADPDQIHNLAADPAHAAQLAELSARLTSELRATADPRIAGQGDRFDAYPYVGDGARYLITPAVTPVERGPK